MTVVALVPARDEAACVAATVAGLLSISNVDRVIVIDDGSSDDTADLARRAGAEVLRLESGRGKGAALQVGLQRAGYADALLLIDADVGATAAHAAALLGPILGGRADMTVGILPRPPHSGGIGAVKWLARRGISLLAGGFTAEAPLSGQRALSSAAVDAATPFAAGFGVEVALTVRALRAGLTVLEVPVEMSHAATGRDLAGFAHRWRQFRDVLATLARLAMERVSPSR